MQTNKEVVQLQTGVVWMRTRETVYCKLQDAYIVRVDVAERRLYMRYCPASGLPNALGAYIWTIPHLESCPHQNHSVFMELLDFVTMEGSVIPPSSFRIRKPDFHEVCDNIRSFVSGPSKSYPCAEIKRSWEEGCLGEKVISRERLGGLISGLDTPSPFWGTFSFKAASRYAVETGLEENGIPNNPSRKFLDLSSDSEWGEDGSPLGANWSPTRFLPGGRKMF